MRSKGEIEKLLEQYDKAINGDADAMIFMSKLLLGLSDKGGVNDGKDIKRTDRGNKKKKK